MVEMSTLAVPKDFAKSLRDDYEGDNDLERLKAWAVSFEEDDGFRVSDYRDEIEEIVDERVEELRCSY